MRKPIVATLLLALACGGEPAANKQALSRDPISVRGWVAEVDTGQPQTSTFSTVETQAAMRQATFQQTQVWVENANYVSGGIAENGAFVLLDVPPGTVTVSFSAPGVEASRLVIENVPGRADVLIPGLILKNGNASVANPQAVQVRLAASVDQPRKTAVMAKVAGNPTPITEVPVKALIDRRDYPSPPGFSPVATVK